MGSRGPSSNRISSGKSHFPFRICSGRSPDFSGHETETCRRYLMMATKGGMYTDSDTAPLSDPNLWGTHAHVLTPPSLRVLQQAMRRLDPAHDDEELESESEAAPSLGINNPKVSMVISVEYDLSHPRQDPRTAYTRDLQMVQWTFLVSARLSSRGEHRRRGEKKGWWRSRGERSL